jgi:hypothetical protein
VDTWLTTVQLMMAATIQLNKKMVLTMIKTSCTIPILLRERLPEHAKWHKRNMETDAALADTCVCRRKSFPQRYCAKL